MILGAAKGGLVAAAALGICLLFSAPVRARPAAADVAEPVVAMDESDRDTAEDTAARTAKEEKVKANAWVDGPEAEAIDEPHPGALPREPGAKIYPVASIPDLPEAPLPLIDHGLATQRPDLRMTTTLSREQVFAFGDLNLADAMAMVPGLWWPYLQAASPLPSARGLGSESTGVRVVGVPFGFRRATKPCSRFCDGGASRAPVETSHAA